MTSDSSAELSQKSRHYDFLVPRPLETILFLSTFSYSFKKDSEGYTAPWMGVIFGALFKMELLNSFSKFKIKNCSYRIHLTIQLLMKMI